MVLQYQIMLLKLVTWLKIAVFIASSTTTSPGDHDPYLLANMSGWLQEMCPYADICGVAASETIPSSNYVSCCRSCSCEPDCGATMSCCYEHLDEYKMIERYNMTCTRASLTLDDVVSYYMIDKCLNDLSKDCMTASNSFFDKNLKPEFSPSTGFIYYNHDCAACNGVSDGILWEYFLLCEPALAEDVKVLKPAIANIDIVTGVDFYNICRIGYYPPQDIDVYSHICSDNMPNACENDTTHLYHTDIMDACMSGLNVMFRQPGMVDPFENPFCFKCSSFFHLQNVPASLCQPLHSLPRFPSSFTVVIKGGIDLTAFSHSTATPVPSTSGCGEFHVYTPGQPDDCRVLHCPVGQIRIGGTCQYFATRWDAVSMEAKIVLTPRDLIPVETIDNLKDQVDQSWLLATGLNKWKFVKVLYSKGTSGIYVKYVLVWIGRVFAATYFNPVKVMKQFKNTINHDWKIVIEDKEYRLTGYLDDEWYYMDGEVYVPFSRQEYFDNNNTVDTDWMMYMLSANYDGDLFLPLEISRQHFCTRIQLRQGEFEWLGERIDSAVKVLSTGRFLPLRGYIVAKDDRGDSGIRVCVEDFIPDWQTQTMPSEGSTPCITPYLILFGLVLVVQDPLTPSPLYI